MTKRKAEDSDDDDVSSEEEGEDLILEGVLVRNPEVESSSDEDEEDEESDKDDGDGNHKGTKEPKKKKVKFDSSATQNEAKSSNENKKNKENTKKNGLHKKAKKKDDQIDIIDMEFTFNDMKDTYFHGIKNYLLNQVAYAPHSSAISDLIIQNISVGTVVSTEDGEDNVFGFASVLNITTFKDESCIQFLRKICLESCPAVHKSEMETVLSGNTKRPAGILLHGRMVNLPLEISHVLHEQLVLDMDWAVDNAAGTEEEKKSFNFGAFVLLAPCVREKGSHCTIYKNFDDEIFAGCAEFVFPLNVSGLKKKSEGGKNTDNEDGSCDNIDIIVLTKEGHRKAMKELKIMVYGS